MNPSLSKPKKLYYGKYNKKAISPATSNDINGINHLDRYEYNWNKRIFDMASSKKSKSVIRKSKNGKSLSLYFYFYANIYIPLPL